MTKQTILSLLEDLKNEGEKFLLANRFNQDSVENCFSIIRNRGKYNPDSSVKQFRIAQQHNMDMKLMNPGQSANCEDDEDYILNLNDDVNILEKATEDNSAQTLQQLVTSTCNDEYDQE